MIVNLLLIWNIGVMLAYGIDKMLAKAHKRRISEATLLTCAFFMGGVGAIFGMVLFNHKTSKMKFRILVPLAILIGMIAIYWGSQYLYLQGNLDDNSLNCFSRDKKFNGGRDKSAGYSKKVHI